MRKHLVATYSFILCAGSLWAAGGNDSVPVAEQRLREVEVSGRRRSQEVLSTAPLRQLDADQLLKIGATDVSDAVHRLPGVTLRDYGGAGGVKTVSVRGFGAGHTAVIYDGIVLGDCQTGQIDLSRYSLDNVGAISMTVGDNDDIFIPARAAASAASLAIATDEAPDSLQLTTQLRLGSWRMVNPFFKIGSPLGSRLYVSAIGEFTYARNDYPFVLRNGAFTSTQRRTNSRMNSGHGEINLRYEIAGGHRLAAKAYYYDNSRQLPGPVVLYNPVNHEHLRERDAFAQAMYRGRLSGTMLIQANAKLDRAMTHYADYDERYPGGETHQRYHQAEAYGNACLLWMPRCDWAFDYSADYVYNTLRSNLATDRRPFRHSLLQSLTARYRSPHMTIMGRMLASLYFNGARRGTSAADYRRLSPSLSLSVKPINDRELHLRASYKSIFRMPTFNEYYFDRLGTPDLKPEKTDQINIGATYTSPTLGPLNALTLTVDGYLNHVEDMIVAVPFNMFVWSMTNLGRVRVLGLDITLSSDVKLAMSHQLTLSANYGLQRAQPRTSRQSSEWNKQVAYIPVHSGSVSLAYENPWVNISVNTTAVSHRFTTNNNLPATRIPGYVETGFTAWRAFNVLGHRVELRADLKNAFNKQYFIVARYPMPSRSWLATIRFDL